MPTKNKLSLEALPESDGQTLIKVILNKGVVAQGIVNLKLENDRQRFAETVTSTIPAIKPAMIEQELLSVANGSPQRDSGIDADWPPPTSLERAAVPEFPVDALPEPLQSWVAAVAEATQTPACLPALLGLAVCASAAARRVAIMIRLGWIEPINLFVACLLDPGNRKSVVFSEAMRPIRMIERELCEQAGPEVARLASERRVKEGILKKIEQKAMTGDLDAGDDATKLAIELAHESIPTMPKLIVDDATAEAVENTLVAQNGRLLVAGCEGGLFDVMAGRYTAGSPNIDVFLKGHAGDDMRVDRVIRGSLLVENACLTLAYAVQPEVVRNMADRPSFRGRGLIGRFLYAIPDSPLGRRKTNPPPDPVPEHISAAYSATVRRLTEVQPLDDSPMNLVLSPDASKLFLAWESEVEPMLGEDGRLSAITDWGAKLCGLTARLCAVLHLVANDRPDPWLDPITEATVESAITLSRWAIDHAKAAVALMTAADREEVDDARHIMRRIYQRGFSEVSQRDIHLLGRDRFDGQPERLDKTIDVLIDRSWLRPLRGTPAVAGPGRPSSRRFQVRPEPNSSGSPVPVAAAPTVNFDPPARMRGVI